jgi:NAD(P)-dependent dehydrogenase (short-subunit alcohol dehydrogenase family)
VKEHNVAVNIIIPGHTRTTGFDEQNRARLAMGGRQGPPPLVPDHIVPLILYLASKDAKGLTGKMFDVMQWNIEHGLGGHDEWADKSFSYEALVKEK